MNFTSPIANSDPNSKEQLLPSPFIPSSPLSSDSQFFSTSQHPLSSPDSHTITIVHNHLLPLSPTTITTVSNNLKALDLDHHHVSDISSTSTFTSNSSSGLTTQQDSLSHSSNNFSHNTTATTAGSVSHNSNNFNLNLNRKGFIQKIMRKNSLAKS